MTLTFGSFCSGIEAATAAWSPLGWSCRYVAEIEPFPCYYLHQRHGASRPKYMPRPEDACSLPERRDRETAIRKVASLPEVADLQNFGDVSQVRADELPPVDIIAAGFPCFPATTKIATRQGFVSIEEVVVGDEVLTHLGRFRRVLHVGFKRARTVTVTGQGHYGLRTTANHPFLARQKWGRSTRIGGKAVRLTGVHDSEWIAADQMAGRFWACVADWPELPVPNVALEGGESRTFPLTEDLFILAGAYLGDGWAHTDDRRGSVRLGLNDAKLAKLRPTLESLGAFSENRERTTVKVTVPSRALARWLIENFGSGAGAKRVPMWALGMPERWRRALLEGYLLTDGTAAATSGRKALTVSRQLALTVRMLANSLGYASSVGFQRTPDTHVIEGRTVNQRDYYRVTASPSARTSFPDGGFRWQLVRNVAPTGDEETVYDLTVEEDHSYVADGIVVHNCQDFSIAGLRGSLSGSRGSLSLTGMRLILEAATLGLVRGAVLEQVPDVLNTADNAWGNILGALVGADAALEGLEHGGKWPSAGMVAGTRARVAWRVLDAQYFGLAQRRERVWAVVDFGDGPDPAAVLFERKGLHGNPAPRRQAREGAAGAIDGGAAGGGDDRPQRRAAAFGGNNTAGPIDVATARTASHTASGRQDFESETFLVEDAPAAPLLAASASSGGYRNDADTAANLVPVAFENGGHFGSMRRTETASPLRASGGDTGDGGEVLIAHSLRAEGFDASEDGTGRGTPIVPVAYSIMPQNSNADYKAREVDVAQPVTSTTGISARGGDCIVEPVAFSCKDSGADAGDLSPTLRAMGHSGSHANAGGQVAVAIPINSDATREGAAVTPSADAAGHVRLRDPGLGVGSDGDPMFTVRTGRPHAVAFSLRGREGGVMPEVEDDDVSPALRAAEGGSTRPFVAFQTRGSNLGWDDEISGTIGSNADRASGSAPMVAFDETQITSKANRSNPKPGDPCHPIPAHGRPPTLASTMAVRRITVVEAERLQGFPDNETLIHWPSANRKGEDLAETIAYLVGHGLTPEEAAELAQAPDGPRYRAIGNSWPVNVARWIGERIAAVEQAKRSAA